MSNKIGTVTIPRGKFEGEIYPIYEINAASQGVPQGNTRVADVKQALQ